MKSMLLISHQYPINKGDANAIKHEIPYISKGFDKIYVLCLSEYNDNDDLLETPENVSVSFIGKNKKFFQKLMALVIVPFISLFYLEIINLAKLNKLSFSSLRRAVSFLVGVILFQEHIKKILRHDKSIHLIYTYWYDYATMSALCLKKTHANILCVTRTHGYDLYEFRNRQNYQPYKLWMDKRIDRIFFISKHGYEYYLNTFAKCNLEKYVIARLGILNKHPVIGKDKKDTNIFYLVSCSAIVPVKRVHLIVKALGEISDCTIHWTHIGDGTDKNKIVSMTNEVLKNSKNISYEFKGFMTNEQVMQFYTKNYFDCFISVSESEGLPVSMMEAISFGIPVVATNVGGVSELVTKDTGTLLAPEGNILEIKKAIMSCYGFPFDKQSAMRQSARLLWESDFNAEVNHLRFLEELLSLVRESPK